MRIATLAFLPVCATLLALPGASEAEARPPGGKWVGAPSGLTGAARSAGRYYRHHRHRFGVVAVEAAPGKYLSDTAWFLSDSAVFLADPEPAPYGHYEYPAYGHGYYGHFGPLSH
jgi:hypothetical protein